MTLGQLLDALDANIKLSIVEGEQNTPLITMYSGGQDQLTSELLDREVDRVGILGKTYLQIHLLSA